MSNIKNSDLKSENFNKWGLRLMCIFKFNSVCDIF